MNGDGSINILDVIRAINIILGLGDEPTDYDLLSADINDDSEVDIVDVVLIVNEILGE